MAVVLNEDEEKNNVQGQTAPVTGGNAVHLAPEGGAISGQGGGGSGEHSGTGPAGGQFATLNDYVNANTPNAGKLADQVIQPIQGQINQAQTDITNTQNDINKQISAGYTPYQDFSEQLKPGNVSAFANDPNNVTAFQKQVNDQYTGPSSAEGTKGYQTIMANLNNQLAQGQTQTGSTAGQSQLLQNVEKSVPHNSGVTALNEAILSKSPDYQSRVTQAFEPFKGLISGLQNYAPTADQAIAQGQQEASKASTSANKAISDAVANENSGVQNALTNAQNSMNTYNTNIGAYQTAANKANSSIQNFLAGNKNISNPTSNNALAPWMNLSPMTGAPNINSAATPQDFAISKALGTLSPTSQLSLDQANAGQAGTFKLPDLPGGSIAGAINKEVGGFGNQIRSAIAPFQDTQRKQGTALDFVNKQGPQLQKDALAQLQKAGVPLNPKTGQPISPAIMGNRYTPEQKKAFDNWQSVQNQMTQAQTTQANELGTEQRLAPNLQWVQGTGNAYNNLIGQLNAELKPLNGLSVPAPTASGGGSNPVGAAVNAVGEANPMLGQFIDPGIKAANQIVGQNPLQGLEQGALNLSTLGIPLDVLKDVGGDITSALGSFGKLISGLF